MIRNERLSIIFKVLFGIALISILLWRLDVNAIRSALMRFRWSDLSIAMAMMALSWPVAAMRWKIFASRITLFRLLELTLVGQFYSTVLPGQLSGELMKAYRLAKGSHDAERLALSVIVDRIVGLLALSLLTALGMMLSSHSFPAAWRYAVIGIVAALIVALLILRLNPIRRFAEQVVARQERTRFAVVVTPLQRAIEAWCDFSAAPGRIFASLALGVIFQLLGIAMAQVLGSNLQIDLAWVDWAWIMGMVSLAILIPVSVGGIGLREGAFVGCLGLFSIEPERAIALSLAFFVLSLPAAAIGGLIELKRTRSKENKRRLPELDG